jgi:hypothetical protein
MAIRTVFVALVAMLLPSGAGVATTADTARAGDCLAAPSAAAPSESHWYYRLDRATQRKCWYLRAPGQPGKQAAAGARAGPGTPLSSMPASSKPTAGGASLSVSSGDAAPPLPDAQLPAVRPRAASAKPDQRSLPGPQANTSSQASSEAAAPAPADPVVWPDALPSVPKTKAREPVAVPTDVRLTSVSDDPTKIGTEPTNSATGTSMIVIFSIFALGLTVVGFLFRFIMNIAAAHRVQMITVEHQEQYRSVDDGQEFFQSFATALSDHSPLEPESHASQVSPEIRKRTDRLAQLTQHLDRLLQSPAGQHDESRQRQRAA